MKRLTLFQLLMLLLLSSCYVTRKSKGGGQTAIPDKRMIRPEDVALPPGYKIESVASGLTFPSAIAMDEAGDLYVIETGYSYGEVWGSPKLLRLNKDGTTTLMMEGERNGPWTGLLYYKQHFYISEGGEAEGGKILKVSLDGKHREILCSGLPSLGDHHTGTAVIKDNYIYFGQGTATNSGIVGPDNKDYGWLSRHPDFHDIPCRDIYLAGQNYTSLNVLSDGNTDSVQTGAFLPFGKASHSGQLIKGRVPCSGSVMRIPLSGGDPELVAWGFRNPYGLALAPSGSIYVTENGYDERGSRPVWGTGDILWRLKEDTWYGWPDYSGGKPVSGWHVPGRGPVKPVLAQSPGVPPDPVAVLGVHASANGMDFSTSPDFGYVNEAFIAEFGDMAPAAGKTLSPVGFKIVRVRVSTGVIEDFAVNKGKRNGPASFLGTGGLERPLSVKFGANGKALYIVDFGIMKVTPKGPVPQKGTGVIWKISKK